MFGGARLFGRALDVAFGVLGEVIAPSRCASCEGTVRERALFCVGCAASVERVDPDGEPDDGAHAVFLYGGAIASAIARMKYDDRADLAPRLARSMMTLASRVARTCGGIDLVVPVPLHARRLAVRGYNQAALLAAPIARAAGVPMATRALRRVRDTPRQALLDRDARLVNVQDAFTARPDLVRGARVLLLDDVRTTGGTLDACFGALGEAGTRSVAAIVLARRGKDGERAPGPSTRAE